MKNIHAFALDAGFHNIVICARYGIITVDNEGNKYQKECAVKFNNGKKGDLKEALVGADAFVGVSAGNILTEEVVLSMNEDSIVFALANSVPEIMPEAAKRAKVKVMATGRSDYLNQINNLLVFPRIIKAALKAHINKITPEIQTTAARGISACIKEEELSCETIIPSVCDIVCSFKK